MKVILKTGQFSGISGSPSPEIQELLRRLELMERDNMLQAQLVKEELEKKADAAALTEQAFK